MPEAPAAQETATERDAPSSGMDLAKAVAEAMEINDQGAYRVHHQEIERLSVLATVLRDAEAGDNGIKSQLPMRLERVRADIDKKLERMEPAERATLEAARDALNARAAELMETFKGTIDVPSVQAVAAAMGFTDNDAIFADPFGWRQLSMFADQLHKAEHSDQAETTRGTPIVSNPVRVKAAISRGIGNVNAVIDRILEGMGPDERPALEAAQDGLNLHTAEVIKVTERLR